ncbi:Anoctamin, partial [Gryllus bimaculatus]
TTFLELWKRRQAVIVWEWDLQNTEEDEEPRPEFEMSVKTFRINPVTREKEPYLPAWSKAWRLLATTSMVLFMVMVVMGAVLGTIVYRISLVTVIGSSQDQFLIEKAKIFTSVTAAIINLVIIMILTNGRFFKHPGDKEARKTEFLRIKTDVCDPAGCLSELCIQLAIIMVGKQFFNNFLEILFP